MSLEKTHERLVIYMHQFELISHSKSYKQTTVLALMLLHEPIQSQLAKSSLHNWFPTDQPQHLHWPRDFRHGQSTTYQ